MFWVARPRAAKTRGGREEIGEILARKREVCERLQRTGAEAAVTVRAQTRRAVVLELDVQAVGVNGLLLGVKDRVRIRLLDGPPPADPLEWMQVDPQRNEMVVDEIHVLGEYVPVAADRQRWESAQQLLLILAAMVLIASQQGVQDALLIFGATLGLVVPVVSGAWWWARRGSRPER